MNRKSTAVATAPNARDLSTMPLADALEASTPQFKAALPAHIPVERFRRVLLTAINSNPDLAKADRRTLFNSAVKAAQDGLLPDGREGALVIYNTKVKEAGQERWVKAVQWMPMIAGIRKKVRNSGEIAMWDAHVVYQNDEFDYRLGLAPDLHHKPLLQGDRGKEIAAYSVARMKSGEVSFEVMTADEIWGVWARASKNKDKSGNPSGPWKDWTSEMFRKTVARRHSKVLPMSTDLDDLIRRDDDLYDMSGASDKAIPEADDRPQLSQFTAPAEVVEAATETNVESEAPEAAESTADPEEETPAAEFGAFEAMEMGREARRQKRPRKPPPELIDEGHIEAWVQGWNEADEEGRAK